MGLIQTVMEGPILYTTDMQIIREEHSGQREQHVQKAVILFVHWIRDSLKSSQFNFLLYMHGLPQSHVESLVTQVACSDARIRTHISSSLLSQVSLNLVLDQPFTCGSVSIKIILLRLCPVGLEYGEPLGKEKKKKSLLFL